MWMTHPSLPGVIKEINPASFYGGWDQRGWVAAAAPPGGVSTVPDNGVSHAELAAALAGRGEVGHARWLPNLTMVSQTFYTVHTPAVASPVAPVSSLYRQSSTLTAFKPVYDDALGFGWLTLKAGIFAYSAEGTVLVGSVTDGTAAMTLASAGGTVFIEPGLYGNNSPSAGKFTLMTAPSPSQVIEMHRILSLPAGVTLRPTMRAQYSGSPATPPVLASVDLHLTCLGVI